MPNFGATPTSTTTIGPVSSPVSTIFPVSGGFVPNTANGDLTSIQLGPSSTDSNGYVSAPVAVYQATGTNLHVVVDSGAITASGTVTANQGGTWNLTNISGTITLPTGAATAAKQPALGTAGSASADVLTVQGIASMTALKVDGSGVTQPVSGTFWQATQPVSGTITANIGTTNGLALDASVSGVLVAQGSTTSGEKGPLIQAAVTTSAPSYTTAQTSPLSLTLAGALRVDASATTQPVSGTFWQATQPVSGTVTANQGGTWTVQPGNTANTTAWKVDGSAVTQPVSGTITANIGTTNGLALDSSVNGVLVAQGSTTSGEKGPMVQGAVTTSAPSYTTAQTSPLSLTTAGALRVDGSAVTQPVSGTFWQATQPVSGTVTANIGTTNGLALDASVNGLLLAQASTTSGQKGPLMLGAVTTNAPSYTTAQSDPLSLDTSGLLRVSIKDTPANTNNFNVNLAASAATVTVTGTVTANQGGSNWSTNVAQIGGTNIITGGASGLLAVAGPVASGSANADNPLKVGGVFNTTQPTVTNGQVVDLQATARGAAIVATGVDTFNVTVNAALPAGGNTIGAVTQASGPWTSNITQFGSSNVATGTGAGGAGIPRVTVSNDTQLQLWDGTRGPVAVKAANTPPTLADLAMVHALSPDNTGLPVNVPAVVQKAVNKSSGSVASLAQAFGSNNVAGNSIVVVCGVGNGTAPTISDTAGNTYTQAVQIANGTALNVAVFFAVNIASGANTVTVNNGGTTASIAMEIYEVSGLIAQIQAQPDQTATNTGSSGTASTGTISAASPNEYAFASVGIGTAAQTITAGSGWTNDSGQQNPTTPAGLFSFISMSQFLGSLKAVTPQATFTSEPWAIAVASFRPVILGVEGSFKVTDGTVNFTAGSKTSANSFPVVIASDQGNVPTNVAQFGGTNVVTGTGAGGSGIPRVTVSNDSTVGANSATGSAVPANGFYEAGLAKTALPTAASDGNLTGIMLDKFGRQIVVTESVRDLKANIPGLTLSTTTETTLIAAVASQFSDITGMICENTSATATRVDFRDSTAGTIQFSLYLPAGDTRGFANLFFAQTTANNNWTAQLGTAVTDVRIYGTYLKNK